MVGTNYQRIGFWDVNDPRTDWTYATLVVGLSFCKHETGWYQTVEIKKWIFKLTKRFFICTDCMKLIDAKERENAK